MRRIEKYDETLTSEIILIGTGLPVAAGTIFALIGTLGAYSTSKEKIIGLISVFLYENLFKNLYS